MMKLRIVAALLLVVVLTACSAPSPAAPTATPTTEAAYPPPAVAVQNVLSYPPPGEGDQVEWAVAEKAILDGQVEIIVQTPSLQVTIKLKDGKVIVANEPALDEVYRAREKCGAPCAELPIVNR
jgi:ABC-type glycerol-3-phosphate transport system substrate-binding protein